MHIPNDTYVYLLMHFCICLLWRKYNRITSVGIGIESIPVSSIIAKAKWAQLAWQQRSALGEVTRLASQWLGRRRKKPPPPLCLRSWITPKRRRETPLFLTWVRSRASIWYLRWKFEGDQSDFFLFASISMTSLHADFGRKVLNVWKLIKVRWIR